MTVFGDKETFAFELRSLSGAPDETDASAAATWVALQLWVEGRNLCEHTHGAAGRYHDALHWPAVYFVRWLVYSWPGFFESQRWPLPGSWRNARDVCRALDALVRDATEDTVLDMRDHFVRTHSLRAGTAGGAVPDIYFSRDGARVSVAWNAGDADAPVTFLQRHGESDVPTSTFLSAVRALTKWATDQLKSVDSTIARADCDAFQEWLGKLDQPEAAVASLAGYVGLPNLFLPGARSVEDIFELAPDWALQGAQFDASRSGAAVVFRALSPVLTANEAIGVLDKLRTFPRCDKANAELERLRKALPSVSNLRFDYQVGCQLAEGVRSYIGNIDRYLDIEALLKSWEMNVVEFEINDKHTDGGCVWDPGHGPILLLNPRSPRTATPWGRRMVIAHELCHLLHDRKAAIPLKVISNRWGPPTIERRADAFAAELLLPRAGIIREIGFPTELLSEEDLQKLMHEFGVGLTTCVNRIRDLFGIELE